MGRWDEDRRGALDRPRSGNGRRGGRGGGPVPARRRPRSRSPWWSPPGTTLLRPRSPWRPFASRPGPSGSSAVSRRRWWAADREVEERPGRRGVAGLLARAGRDLSHGVRPHLGGRCVRGVSLRGGRAGPVPAHRRSLLVPHRPPARASERAGSRNGPDGRDGERRDEVRRHPAVPGRPCGGHRRGRGPPARDRDPGSRLPGMPPHRQRLRRDAGGGERHPRAGRSAAPPATAGARGDAPARGPRAGRSGPPRGSRHRRVQDRAGARGLPDPGGGRGWTRRAGRSRWETGSRSGRPSSSTCGTRPPRTRICAASSSGRRSRRPERCCSPATGGGHACSRSRITTRRSFRRSSGAFRLAGFNCAGEIGPIGGKNFLHGFTASIALFVDA